MVEGPTVATCRYHAPSRCPPHDTTYTSYFTFISQHPRCNNARDTTTTTTPTTRPPTHSNSTTLGHEHLKTLAEINADTAHPRNQASRLAVRAEASHSQVTGARVLLDTDDDAAYGRWEGRMVKEDRCVTLPLTPSRHTMHHTTDTTTTTPTTPRQLPCYHYATL
jgi:hypothetical protein